jgi:hypothetical protein
MTSMPHWVRISVAGVVMLVMTFLVAAPASAQSRDGLLAALAMLLGASSSTDPSPSSGSAGLSPRDQKLARVIYQAQRPEAPAPRLTLEQITARKIRGETWTEVLKDMKARGLVSERSLLQALVQAGGEGVVRPNAANGVVRANASANGKPYPAPTAVGAPRDDDAGDGQKLKQ